MRKKGFTGVQIGKLGGWCLKDGSGIGQSEFVEAVTNALGKEVKKALKKKRL